MPGRGNKVSYVENDEPSFIKRFKERIGYKEGPNVETKRELPDFNDEDEESTGNKDDEKPTVVVLKNGDLTSEEAEQLQLQIDKEEPAHTIGDKIVFKQPKKRQAEEEGEDISGEQVKKSGKTKGNKNKQKSKEKKQKKNSLLSFDEEEEDDT
ncbi:hypothetical protein SNE40_002094 [Patella caerulea]|uniref:DUF4604 domain-containing protein n=1 Tax=Patella caerulea TaxID=87958 RepID=A0AAN8K7V3_PATCE